jgi:hypothetical protein
MTNSGVPLPGNQVSVPATMESNRKDRQFSPFLYGNTGLLIETALVSIWFLLSMDKRML